MPVAALAVAPSRSLRHCAYIQRRLIRRCIPARSGAAFAVAFAYSLRLPVPVKAPHSGAEYVASVGFGAEYVASASAAATAMPPLLLFFWLLVLSNRAPVPVAALAVAPYWSLRHCAYIQRRLIRRCIPARSGAAFAVAFAYLRRLPLRVIAPRSGASQPVRSYLPSLVRKRDNSLPVSGSSSLVLLVSRPGFVSPTLAPAPCTSPPLASAPSTSPQLQQQRRHRRGCCCFCGSCFFWWRGFAASSSSSYCCGSSCVRAPLLVRAVSFFIKIKKTIVPRCGCSYCSYRYFKPASKPKKRTEYVLFLSFRRRFLPLTRQKVET